MRDAPLAEIARPSGRRAGPETDLPVYSVTKHAGFVRSLDYFKKQVFSRDLKGYKIVDAGEFAYATIHLDEGSIGIAPERALISPMYTIFSIDETRVDPTYLIRFLKSPRALAHYPHLGRGAIHRRKAISLAALGALDVPLPPIADQRRIAAILDHADALGAKRRQVLAHLGALTRSIFHKMFARDGNSLRTAEILPLGDLVTVKSGVFLPARSHDEGPYPIYGGNGVTGHHSSYLFDEPKIVIGRVGAYCGAVHLAPPKSWITDNAMYVAEVHRDVSLTYLRDALTVANLNQFASRSGQPLISSSRIKAVPITVPGPLAQATYACRIESVEARVREQQSMAKLEDELFGSLQSRAFRGELW